MVINGLLTNDGALHYKQAYRHSLEMTAPAFLAILMMSRSGM
jgi:hypothetical protein